MATRNNEEHKIQCGIVDWYDLTIGDGLLFAIPNGGARDARTGAMLKAEGVRKGVWDLFLAKPCLNVVPWFHGLWIEVKTPKRRTTARGGLTIEQNRFWAMVRLNGYKTEVVYTTQEGIDAIARYLK